MNQLSLCLIVKNEEMFLDQCLSSVKDVVDEIIIVDTGSTDTTKEIAKKYTDHIYDFPWINDFAAARNYSFSKATKDYIFWLDADDVLLPEDALKLKNLKESMTDKIDYYMMKYHYAFDETGNVSLSLFRERIVKRSRHFIWKEPIHEFLAVQGNSKVCDVVVTHRRKHPASGRNLAVFEAQLKMGSILSTRSKFYYARELYDNQQYEKSIEQFEDFLNCTDSSIEDRITGCFYLSYCYAMTNQPDFMIKALLRSFEFTTPRAEICCRIGDYFILQKNYLTAIFWFNMATNLKPDSHGFGFVYHDFYGFIPHLQLCLCYANLGYLSMAYDHFKKASKYHPNSEEVKHYQKFFNRQHQLVLDQIQKQKEELVKLRKSYQLHEFPAVSIVTVTNKKDFAPMIIDNYHRSSYPIKELILVLNNDELQPSDYSELANGDDTIHIYQLKESTSLGNCLNFGIAHSHYDYIAKMDDDDFYGENYLLDMMYDLISNKGDVVGKSMRYIYFEADDSLYLFQGFGENLACLGGAGATLLAPKHIFEEIPFQDLNLSEDEKFLYAVKDSKYQFYSSNKFNYYTIRRSNKVQHTHQIDDAVYIPYSIYINTTDKEAFVSV